MNGQICFLSFVLLHLFQAAFDVRSVRRKGDLTITTSRKSLGSEFRAATNDAIEREDFNNFHRDFVKSFPNNGKLIIKGN